MGEKVRDWWDELVPDRGPARMVVFLSVVQALGSGVFLTSSAIFFTRVVEFSPTQVGVGLSLAGLCGFAAAVPAGRIADHFGARVPLALSYGGLAILFVVYLLVDDFAGFVVVASLVALCQTAGSPLRSALAVALFGKGAVRVRAQMRSAYNLGFVGGAALAAIAIAQTSRAAFVMVLVANALAQASCMLLTLRLPPGAPVRTGQPTRRSRSALRDMRFVGVALLSGALELYQPIMDVGVPLWIITWTAASPAVNSLLLVLNTVAVVLLQVAMSRGADTAAGGARLLRRSGLLLAGACVVYAASNWGNALIAGLVLVAGSVLLVLGELAQSAGGYALSFELPPPGQEGAYQGVFALGRGLQQFAGPALVTALAVGLGPAGWMVLACLFIVLALLCVPVIAWAERIERRDEDAPAGRGL
jgi:MFS family permease